MKLYGVGPVHNADTGGGTGGGGGGAPAPAAAGAPAAPQMPAGLPEQFWDATAGSVKVNDLVGSYAELNTFKSEYDAKMAALPAKPDDYKIDVQLPKDWDVPKDYKFEINEDDPRLPMVREFAHKHKLSPEVLNELALLDAKIQIENHKRIDAEIQAEMKKLGQNGQQRIDAVNNYLKANVSPEEHQALRLAFGDAAAFQGLEKLVTAALKQGVPPNGGEGGSPQKPQPAQRPSLADRLYGSNGKAS